MASSVPLLFLIFISFFHPIFARNLSLKYQASVLLSIKHSLDSPNPFLESWNLSNYDSLCEWVGVKCDEKNISIISIDVSNFNLVGPLSSSIKKLVTLKSLNVSNNQLNGSLSYEFTPLKELEVFDAYDNSFSGLLPLGFTQIPTLKHLNLGGNYFSGEIPPAYGSLSWLNYLSLAGNDLRGFIPRELGNLTNLTHLYLGYFNQFKGGIPLEFGKLVNLVHLDLSNCGLKGEIPQEIGNLKNLDTLFMQTNQLSGSIPPQLGNLTSLKSLDLSLNGLTGEIPVELSSLKELTLLNLFINKFHGNIPRFIAELPKLEVLKLWRNNFTGSIPSKLGSSGNLIELDLSTNKLTGLIPKTLCLGRKLKILILLNNFFFGPLPEDLGRCESLSRVRMGQNYLSGTIPNGFLYLPQISLVELQNNYLTGNFTGVKRKVRSQLSEEEREVRPQLEQLNLSNNRLFGTIPSSLGDFSGLKILMLSGNQFTGEIPSDIGRLKNILKIDMSRNNFSGEIPNEIGKCLSLTYLDFSQNELNGPIPIQIGQIHVLNYLNISYNHLNQSLPKEIGSIKSLTSADFSHNNLSGSIPEIGQYLFFNTTSFIGNPGLCGSSFTPCNNSSASTQNPKNQEGKNTNVPSKYKLIFALGLLFCSLTFVLLAILKTRKAKRNSKPWKLIAFQKLGFGSDDIIECLKDNHVIGRGGAGVVYSGTMPNGEQVAIKKLGNNKGGGGATSLHDNGLSAEIKTLGKIRHRYIVRLLAFCSNKEMNLLIYEYMPNGSLGEVLHGKMGGCLKWETRLKIAIEAAKGLCYLHHDCSPLILHRDVKSNNILLSSDFEAHVADFGLAKFLQDTGNSECMSAIAGSYGYIAPEYAYTLKVDEKSDVYSFGVVLLELLTGRKPVGDFGEEGLDIVQWVKIQTNWSKEQVAKIVDERLKSVPLYEAKQVFFVAMLCVQEHSVERPTMREVVQMLVEAKQLNVFHMH